MRRLIILAAMGVGLMVPALASGAFVPGAWHHDCPADTAPAYVAITHHLSCRDALAVARRGYKRGGRSFVTRVGGFSCLRTTNADGGVLWLYVCHRYHGRQGFFGGVPR